MYNYNDFEDGIEEEYNENLEEKNKEKENKKEKQPKNKKSTKIKRKTVVKTKKEKPKTKIVYKEKEKGSGCLSVILILIILGLLAVIAYLVYTNYYEKEDNTDNIQTKTEETEKICEAKATKFNISSGLKKCSDKEQFKLLITSTNLSFDMTRTSDKNYIINSIYYKDKKIETNKIIGIQLKDDWQLKEKDNLIYLLVQKEDDTQIITVIDNGKIIYQNSDAEYKLNSNVIYTKYTKLGLENVNTCEYYETNNLLDSEMWTSGELIYENGVITEKESEVVTAKDICKK